MNNTARIKKIKISNFKSFDEQTIELNNFNVIIGSNASGKSSFVSIFEFVNDVMNFGLENAISMHGGQEYITNINIRNKKPLSIELSIDLMNYFIRPLKSFSNDHDIIAKDMHIQFSIDFTEMPYRIIKDIVTITIDAQKNSSIVDTGQITFESKDGGNVIMTSTTRKIKFDTKTLQEMIRHSSNAGTLNILLENQFLIMLFTPFMPSQRNLKVFDFYPKLMKRALPITGKIQLNSDGSNLDMVLKRIMTIPDDRRLFYNLLSTTLPFIKDITHENSIDKSVSLKIAETYNKEKYLPASLISDGAISVTALIIALFFEGSSTIIIKEPERNIHPSLLSNIIHLMQDASYTKQVIITTHNPQIVQQAGTKNLTLIHRDADGFSKITKPKDNKQVQEFLKNEMDLADLYTQDLLN